jgi:hypothetical protein
MPAIKMLKDDMDAMVIGLSDGNPGTNYWTICMIRRSYIQDRSGVVDMPNRVFFPYNHNFQDTEFTATAIARGVWRKSEGKCIEHHHPGLAQYFGPVEYDKTYHKNDDTVALDHQTYLARRHLWESPSA